MNIVNQLIEFFRYKDKSIPYREQLSPDNGTLILYLKEMINMGMGKVLFLFLISLPLGIIAGGIELLFGFTILYFLSSLHIMSYGNLPNWFFIKNILTPTWAFLIVGILRVALSFLSLLINSISSEGFGFKVRRIIVDSIFSGEALESGISVAELSNLQTNLIGKATNFIYHLLNIITYLFFGAFVLISLFSLSPQLSIVTVISLVLLGLPVLITRKSHNNYSSKRFLKFREFSIKITKGLKNLYFLKIIGQQYQQQKILYEANYAMFLYGFKYYFGFLLNSNLPGVVVISVVLSIITVNRKFHFMDNSIFLPFIYLLIQINANTGKLIMALGNMQFDKRFFSELMKTLREIQLVNKTHETMEDVIEVSTVETLKVEHLAIGRDSILVKDININSGRGGFVYITGHSGKGKTTLLMTLIGLIPAMEGAIYLNGIDIKHVDFKKFRKYLAYSGPDPFLFDATIRENILFGTDHMTLREEEIWRAMDIAECDFVRHLPEQLDHMLYEGGEGISAGQKQRLSIARALLRNPKILLLDEATANIDEKTEEKIITAIRYNFPDVLIFAVSHRKSLIKHAICMIEL
ncbi:MAG: ABC transporter ATP-binding protein [Nitrospirae bacterium]|nr:ABC transporter ATP-binding protein [Nitrospirota bacterium]MBF0535770.1 ABC transporter ATP-binding protein [Nitrospirota bacterium]MBF0617689.1 ABC transporter ATP-binding protein [Nitrospirota bacterium]